MSETTTKSWLQRLKDESWEAELLVSVASIVAMFQAFGFLDWTVDFFIDKLNPNQYFIGYIVCFMGYLAFGLLTAFFSVHFGLRAYWIGLIGLNSVFPDYSIEDSAYSEIYSKKMAEKLPKLTDTIDRLDEICSVIFSAAFNLLLVYGYFGIFSSVYLLLYNVLSEYVSPTLLLIPLYLLGALYVALSGISIVANLKRFKTHTTIQHWYYHIALLGSKVFYGPFYKYIMQITMIFGTNFKKKKALVRTTLLMIGLGMWLGIFQIFQSNVGYLLNDSGTVDTTRIRPEYYKTNNDEATFLLEPEIQDEIINNAPLKLFIPFFDHETTILEHGCGIEKINILNTDEEDKVKRWKQNLNCYAASLNLDLDQNEITTEFKKMEHPITEQFGLMAFISTDGLNQGKHELTVVKKVDENIQKKWIIPFYRANMP